jgi:hypothetical protein
VTVTNTVPGWLWQPSTSTVDPPVDSRLQDLPFEKLEWVDFERLCTHLASRTANVEHTQQYGIAGQEQEGIDIYARKVGTDRYSTWQCKRYQSFSARQLRAAAEDFLSRDWATKSDAFHLCVSVRIEDRSLSYAIEAVAPSFVARNITFAPLGNSQLSRELKAHPDLVDDFFGRAWVTAFCGEEAATLLSRRHRLSPGSVSRLRELLRRLYAAHFDALDPGLPSAAYNAVVSIPIIERFVEPDIVERRRIEPHQTPDHRDQSTEDAGRPQQDRRSMRMRRETQDVRLSLSSWLGQNRLSTIIGDAGCGKTTLLRVIALDLLSSNPQHESLAREWGARIPVWIPFALWVRSVTESSEASLFDVVTMWLRTVGAQPELHDLLAEAIEDDRVLLLVDGIDEWTSEAAAGVAVALLQTFVGAREVAAIATSRPLGYERLSGLGADWAVGYLGPLTIRQQQDVASRWFAQQEASIAPNDPIEAIRERSQGSAQQFMTEIGYSSSLRDLASTPLLLTGLIALHLAGERLPTSRFRAHERLTALLTHEHARRRVRATLAPRASAWSDDTRDRVLDAVAYTITTSTSPTAIDWDAARTVATNYLSDILGREKAEAFDQAAALIDELCDTHGVLVERSVRELGFLHKCFQDFLAARFLSREPLDRQREFVRVWATVPHAHDVILSLCFLTTKVSDVDAILDELHNLRNDISSYAVDALAAQVALSDLNASPRRARRSAKQAMEIAAADEWQPVRSRLVNTVLDGLNSGLLRPIVLKVLSEWFPLRSRRIHEIYAGMTGWAPNDDVINALLHGLGRDEISDRHASARTLATLAEGNDEIESRLIEMMFTGDTGTSAACLNALGTGWRNSTRTGRLLEEARASRDEEVRLVGALRRVSLGVHDDRDLEILVEIASDGSSFQPSYEFRREISETIMLGWPGDEKVRVACLASVRERWGDRRVLRVDISAPILLGGYPFADDIADSIADVFHESEFLDHRLSNQWAELLGKYRRNPTISAAIDDWLETYQLDSRLVDGMDAAALSGSATAKEYVLSNREHRWGSPFWSARALLAGWERGDANIEAALEEMISTPERAQHLADLVPQIVNDSRRSEAILFGVLEQPRPYRIDGAVRALQMLGYDHQSDRFADAVCGQTLDRDQLGYSSTFVDIVTALHRDRRVRTLALRELHSRDPQAGVVARFFSDDPEIQRLVLQLTRALPQSLRQIVTDRLSAVAIDDRDAEALLCQYDMDVDAEVKVSAAVGYWSAVQSTSGVDQAALARLNDDIRATGFDYEDRRQAAFAAFVVINRVDIPATATHQVGDQVTNVREYLAHRAADSLLRLIAKEWRTVHTELGDDLWANVSAGQTSSIEALAQFAEENQELREALLKRIEIASPSELGEASILLLAREQRKTEFVKTRLFEILEERDLDWFMVRRKLVAVDVLGRDFHHLDVADSLSNLAAIGNDEALIGLCDWWPEHNYVRDLGLDQRTTTRRYRRYAEMSIGVATYDTPALLEFLSRAFGRFRGDIWEFHARSTDALVRRLSHDEGLREAAVERLTAAAPSADEKASWPGLLRRAGAFSPALAEWCIAEITRQRRRTFPDLGMDVNAGVIRNVRRSLLDAVPPLA